MLNFKTENRHDKQSQINTKSLTNKKILKQEKTWQTNWEQTNEHSETDKKNYFDFYKQTNTNKPTQIWILIQIRGGNLSKVRSHLETVHDSLYRYFSKSIDKQFVMFSFFSADILIAVMFLGQHEKEVFVFLPCFCVACFFVACAHFVFISQVILEKVVPRIKNVLDSVKDSAQVY